jgi:transposase
MTHDVLAGRRAVYSDEFKRFVVQRLRKKEQSATNLAIELGIRRNQLYKWAKKFDDLGPAGNFRSPGRPPASEGDELTQLRHRLTAVEEELEILKKFDAYSTRRTR